jgi:hypothetical protein
MLALQQQQAVQAQVQRQRQAALQAANAAGAQITPQQRQALNQQHVALQQSQLVSGRRRCEQTLPARGKGMDT